MAFRITPREITKVIIWVAFGVAGWLLFKGLDGLINFPPLTALIIGLIAIPILLLLIKTKNLPL